MHDEVTRAIIVKANVEEVYHLWANFENFPNFMKNMKSVTKTGERTSHWVMEGPLGKSIEWDAETTRLDENKRIAWNSTGGDIKTSGQVSFNELPQGETEITVILKYVPPAGMAGELIASLFGDPEGKLDEDLRNFKAYAEGMYNRTSA
ncbi:MAG: SRPBCC family protein [Ardenticatenales bacterium]|nr:SRPBCC family protein [Ardenticatenales bacterium]